MKIKAPFGKHSSKDTFWSFVFIIGIIFVGCLLGWEQYNEVKDLVTSKQWSFTMGVVTESDLYWQEGVNNFDPGENVAAISYSYAVGLENYSGEVCTKAALFTSKLKRLSNKYPQGSQISVYYHPDRPDLSIVEPGLNISLIMMLASSLFLGLGIRFLIVELKGVFRGEKLRLYSYNSDYRDQELENLEKYLEKQIDAAKNVSEITKPKE